MVAVDHLIECQHTQQYRHGLSIAEHAEEPGCMRRRPTMVGLVISQSILKNRDQAGNARAASSQNLSLQRFWQLTVPLPGRVPVRCGEFQLSKIRYTATFITCVRGLRAG